MRLPAACLGPIRQAQRRGHDLPNIPPEYGTPMTPLGASDKVRIHPYGLFVVFRVFALSVSKVQSVPLEPRRLMKLCLCQQLAGMRMF